MRTVPESIKLALADSSLPIKKRLLLYRRKWNADTLKYAIETEPVDITDLLIEAGPIKMALDTDEVDKWDVSNVTLVFNNELNCFKEGLTGGLFENAVLWGSKVVYNIETSEKGALADSITVFTGYVYSSPVFRDNGNRFELTATSSLDALEYISAEGFCLTKTDELATVVQSQNSKDQGKEFTTSETGVGYVDEVKYGADFASAQTLSAGNDYNISDTNEYTKPAIIKLKFTPTDGYQMWLSYRYWHKDMAIEDIVNALLNLTHISNRSIEVADFGKDNAVEYVSFSKTENMNIMFGFGEQQKLLPLYPSGNSNSLALTGQSLQSFTCRLPTKGYFNMCSPDAYTQPYCSIGLYEDNTCQNGLIINSGVGFFSGKYSAMGVTSVRNGRFETIRAEYDYLHAFIGFELINNKIRLYYDDYSFKAPHCRGPVKYLEYDFNPPCSFFNYASYFGNAYIEGFIGYTESIGQPDLSNRQSFYNSIFHSDKDGIYNRKGIRFDCVLGNNGTRWKRLQANSSVVNNGKGQWYYSDSDDGFSYSSLTPIQLGDIIPSSKQYLRIYYRTTSDFGYEQFENASVSKLIGAAKIPLVNLTGLTVGEAIAQLAKMVSYEIGFNQDGTFFFRSRTGINTGMELSPKQIISLTNNAADIDTLANRVSVEFGNFKTTVDDNTEGKPHPNSMDIYGIHEKTISDDNFIPADNVDISIAIAQANYRALSALGYTVQVDSIPFLELELGDKITVCSENTNIADKTWSDYNKFIKLPIWKRVFKIIGIELSFAKCLMSLTLKDATTEQDVPPLEYNVYQTQFPTPLNYKE